jgi:hypothetical protein
MSKIGSQQLKTARNDFSPEPDSAEKRFSILKLSKYSSISPSFDIPRGGVVDPKVH